MESSLLMPREDEIVDQEEVNLLELAVVLLKRKRLILAVASGLAVLTLVLCLVITPIYQGTAQILPPSEDSATSSILSQLSGAAGAAVGLLGVSTAPSALTYVGILKSNTVFDAIIDQFGLMDVFRNNRFLGRWRNYYREDARDDLLDITKIELDTESNMISISVQDENPNKSAKIANSFVTELKNILHSIDVAEATQRRSFFLGQFKQTLQDVTKAEEELKRFEQATGAIQLDEQARAVLAGIAALEAQAAAKEIELKVMKTYATERNPDLMRVQEELNGLREQRRKLEASESSYFSYSNTIIPAGQVPALSIEYLRKQRELKYQLALYDVLLKQYEVARLDEVKDSSTIRVVTAALPPEKVYKPKLVLVPVLAGGVGLFVAIFLAFVLEVAHRLSQNPRNKARIDDLRSHLKRL